MDPSIATRSDMDIVMAESSSDGNAGPTVADVENKPGPMNSLPFNAPTGESPLIAAAARLGLEVARVTLAASALDGSAPNVSSAEGMSGLYGSSSSSSSMVGAGCSGWGTPSGGGPGWVRANDAIADEHEAARLLIAAAHVAHVTRTNVCSLLQDRARGRPSEAEAYLGWAWKQGMRHGVEMPMIGAALFAASGSG